AGGAVWKVRGLEFRDDVIDGGCVRLHRKGDVGIAKRSVALSVAREIKRDDRDVLAARVGPDVELGPMQDRMDPKMRTRRRRSVEMVPELRRLIAHVPSALETARREHALLRARRFFITPNAGDQPIEAVFRQRQFQTFSLAGG